MSQVAHDPQIERRLAETAVPYEGFNALPRPLVAGRRARERVSYGYFLGQGLENGRRDRGALGKPDRTRGDRERELFAAGSAGRGAPGEVLSFPPIGGKGLVPSVGAH